LAAAYDDMLDALEAGMRVAAKLERRSGTFETRWRQVLEAAQEAYVAVDASGVVVDGNRRTEELFGWSREEMVGRRPPSWSRSGTGRGSLAAWPRR